MTVKPVDIQANLNQMHEVGRIQQARTDAIAEQQHHLDKESVQKSLLSNSKLEETKKGEGTAIRDEDSRSKESRRESSKRKEREKKKESGKRTAWKDDTLGRFIDIEK